MFVGVLCDDCDFFSNVEGCIFAMESYVFTYLSVCLDLYGFLLVFFSQRSFVINVLCFVAPFAQICSVNN